MTTIDGKTQLVGLLGWPVSHSFSPAMHNAAAQALGINWTYLPLPVPETDLALALKGLPALGFRGVNVTVPHKQRVIPFLDTIDESAQAIGAVNTILISHTTTADKHSWFMSGTNTDWIGFLADLAACKIEVKNRDCLVLGAGGSARAVVYALTQSGARVHVLARRHEQAQKLVTDFRSVGEITSGLLTEIAPLASTLIAPLIVNTTPLGMTPKIDDSIWPGDVPFPSNAFVYDLVYNPRQTRFMQQALASGCRVSNGLGMLVHQGALAFELWTGYKPDIGIMSNALEMALF